MVYSTANIGSELGKKWDNNMSLEKYIHVNLTDNLFLYTLSKTGYFLM